MNVTKTLNNKGLTLIELLISMAILAILALGFASIFLPAIKLEGKAVQINHGTAEMATLIEDVMETGTSSLPAGVADSSKDITIQFSDGTTITGPGVVIQTQDPETGATLEAYVNEKHSSSSSTSSS